MKLALIAFAAAAVAAPAFAQAPAANPAMQSAMANVQTQCAADMKTYCDGKAGPDRRACMADNMSKLSDGCKSAIQAMMAARASSGGGGAH